ncbi:hypothetical protein RHGRI_020969 [Rhododendron griersonianum]|uniref:HAT C-terminal dimerisation domain-containing protein n=1 Tax=Rhododendron griersonianum TaxID=479676 RepID=A0AAV6JPF7_9ERIC|nr:hypothetical protein RHGRI_020969 [Rhododendron griersonianum]
MDSASAFAFATASSGNSSVSSSSQTNAMDTIYPLWSYVTKLEKLGNQGGNTLWQCNFCSVVKKRSYTRVRGHLLKLSNGIGPCQNVTKEVLATMKKLDEEAKARMKENAPKKVPLPPSTRSSGFVLEGYETKKQRTSGSRSETISPVEKAFDRAKNVENNQVTYDECSWITIIADDVSFIKNYIMNHSMRLAIFNDFVPLKLLSVASTRFASVMVMLKRFKLLKTSLQTMIISPRWNSYREDDTGKAKFVKEKVLDDIWWDDIDYILSFTSPMYDMLRICDTDKPCLHLVYDMWDTMIEKVEVAIYRHEGKRHEDSSTFYEVVHAILVDRWNKNNTPLHCLAHSLNPRYYSDEWLHEGPSRVPPHKDVEVARERMKCMKRYFPNSADRSKANMEFANFSSKAGEFGDSDSIHDRYAMDPKSWWVTYGASAPLLQSVALKLLVQPSSSSCSERNWSTYLFVHSAKRNKMTPKRAEDLVFIHSNIRLLSRRTRQYMEGQTKMWDIVGDAFDTFGDVGDLEIAQLSLDEPELEAVVFTDDGDDGEIGDEAMED